MRRKVIKQGHNTLTITLPAKWVEKNGIKPSDELEMDDKGKSLVINPTGNGNFSKAKLDGDSLDLFLLKRYLNTLYKMGCDEIEYTFSNPNMILNVQEILQKNLMGYEIIHQGKNSCTIRSLSVINESEFDNTLRRVFLLLKALAEATYNAIQTKDLAHLKNAAMLEENNNRLTTYCRRILNKFGYKDYSKTCFVYLIVEQLEKIADEYKYLVDDFEKKDCNIKNISTDTLRIYERANAFIDSFYDLYYNCKRDETIKFAKEYKDIMKKAHALIETKKREEVIILHYLISITTMTFDILAPTLALYM